MIVEGKTGRFSMKGPFTRSRNVVNRFSACDRSEPAVKLKRGIKEIPWRVNERVPFTVDRKREGERGGTSRPTKAETEETEEEERAKRATALVKHNYFSSTRARTTRPSPPRPLISLYRACKN